MTLGTCLIHVSYTQVTETPEPDYDSLQADCHPVWLCRFKKCHLPPVFVVNVFEVDIKYFRKRYWEDLSVCTIHFLFLCSADHAEKQQHVDMTQGQNC